MILSALEDLRKSVESGDQVRARASVGSLLTMAVPPLDILNRALLPAMATVGIRFRDRDLFLPDVLVAARAMTAAMSLLEPVLLRDGVSAAGTVVLGTVRGDLHDIGKNLVAVMLRGAGYHVVDLGTDVEADAIIDAALEARASVIGLSALLTTTMTEMASVLDRMEQRGLRGSIRTIVGGAPVTPLFAREIGADDYAPDAVTAVERVRALIRS